MLPTSGADATRITPHEVWIVDTSSIVEVRRDKIPKADRPGIWRGLTMLVKSGSLVFPREVFGELDRDHENWTGNRPDEPWEWARGAKEWATRHGTDYAAVKAALAKASDVLDHEKVGGADEADPYVLGLALRLKGDGHDVTVVTQEIKDRPDKMSLNSACGLLRLVSLPLLPFLREREIWRP